jgi:hypothetical protein
MFFGCILFIIMMDMFLLLAQIWGYVYLQRYHSFGNFFYINFTCEDVQVYSVIGLFFFLQYVLCLMFGRLCHMCVLCEVYVRRALNSVCLSLWPGFALYIGH